MAFTSTNDINILSSADAAVVGAGAGNDTYIVSPGNLPTSTQVITISDTLGTNKLQLIGGLTIASSKVAANAIQLKLSNGATININGADTFTFEIGGDPLSGAPGTVQTFAQFVTTSLGLAAVPTGTTVSSGATNVGVNANGTTTASGGAYTLAAAAAAADEGTTATFNLTAPAGTAAGTEVPYTLTGIDAADLASGALTGKAVVGADGKATINVALAKDGKTEGAETLTVTLDGKAVSANTTVNDTSKAATFTLAASADNVNEGVANTFTVTASEPVAVDTTVTFQLKVDAAGDTAQAADFNAGSFNPVTVTIKAGETSANFSIATITNDGTEVSEKYTVEATVGTTVLTKQVTILDGSVGAGQTFTLTKELDIIPGMKGSNDNTVTSGNDTVIGVIEVKNDTGAAVATTNSTLNATDLINTGEGTDTMKIVLAGAVTATSTDYNVPTNFEGVEILEFQSSATFVDATEGVILDTSAVSGLTTINVTKSSDVLKLTAAATTDVNVSMKASADDTDIEGGNNVTVTVTDVAANTNTIDIGGTTAAKGAVTVSATGTATIVDNGDFALGQIDVKGGTTINVTQKATSGTAVAAAFTTGTTVTQGAVKVTGDASTTTVTVKQDAAVAEVLATNKTGGVTETASVKFGALKANDTLTAGGLTFTASADMTAAQAAAAFANLINGSAYPSAANPLLAGDTQGSGLASLGVYTGNFTGWTSGAVSGDTVVFTSTTANGGVGDLTFAHVGTGTAPTVTTTQGAAHNAGAAGGVLGVATGVVTINDASSKMTTVTVDGYANGSAITGASTVLSTLNLSNAEGTASFTVADSAETLTLNLEKLGSLVNGTQTDAVVTLTAASPATLNVKSVGNNYVNLTAAATTDLNVSGTGLLNVGVTDLAALKTVKVTETAGLTLNGGESDTLTSVDTTGTTGTVTATIDAGHATASATYAGGAGVDNVTLATTAALTKAITLGAGNDTLSFGALNVTGSTASVDGGDGTDTLVMQTATAAALDAGKQSFYTNFERLTISDAGADATVLDLANLGFTNYVTANGSAGTLTLDKLASNGTVVLNAAPATGTTVQIADAKTGTADVLNLVTTVGTADVNFKTLTAAEVETVNIQALDTQGAANTASLTLVATKATKITATGNSNLTLTNTGNTKVAEIDGSTMNGALTVTAAGTTASTIKGGLGNDVLTASTAAIGTVNATGTSAVIKADGTPGSIIGKDATKEVQTLTVTADLADGDDEVVTVTYGTNASGGTGTLDVDLTGILTTDKAAVAAAVKNALNVSGAFSGVAVATVGASAGVDDHIISITYNTAGVNIDTTASVALKAGTDVPTFTPATTTQGAAAVAEVTTVVLTDGTTNTGLSAGDTMSLKVGGTTFTYTADGTKTVDEAGLALTNLIKADAKVADATYTAGTNTITITAATAGATGLAVGTYAVTDATDVGATADTLIGGAGNDTLIANAAMSVLTGGAGNDVFVINTASLNVNSASTVTDFSAGDLIQFNGADSFAASKVTLDTTAVFQDYANAAVNAIGPNDLSWFQYGGNTYIIMDVATTNSTTFINGEDFIVKLTGLVDLSTATFNATEGTIGLA